MALNETIARVTDAIRKRSRDRRDAYLSRIEAAGQEGPNRAHLSCGNLAHAYAAMPDDDKGTLTADRAPNLGIVTAYNDMLSAHQPYETYPEKLRAAARKFGATAQVAGGVPAMCDGVTQGQPGMELSLFSRDAIALSAGVALSHNVFDAAIYLGICDKIVPGLVMAAGTFGHLPAIFLPSGPMPSGITNDEKSEVRNAYARGELGRKELMASEMKAYHGPGTCTFYGTANTNQMLMEFMGLHLPGAAFVNPGTPLREALTEAGVKRALEITALGNAYIPAGRVLDERAFVNGIVGLNATGGSTNLVIHIIAMARAAGHVITVDDLSAISDEVPLMARVYPNGLADVNHFHAAGGTGYLVGELLRSGLLHEDVETVMGQGIEAYAKEPKIKDGELVWEMGATRPENDKILRPVAEPFQQSGGLKTLRGELGEGVMKISAVKPERHVIEAPVAVFHDQEDVKAAFKAGDLDRDVIIVVRFQGPKANGMPELHSLTPPLTILQERGHKVALVTDGRMSGASGKVPAAIHVCPEAQDGGPIARLRDGDILRVDATGGRFEFLTPGIMDRDPATADLSANEFGIGRELFGTFRRAVGPASEGACAL